MKFFNGLVEEIAIQVILAEAAQDARDFDPDMSWDEEGEVIAFLAQETLNLPAPSFWSGLATEPITLEEEVRLSRAEEARIQAEQDEADLLWDDLMACHLPE